MNTYGRTARPKAPAAPLAGDRHEAHAFAVRVREILGLVTYRLRTTPPRTSAEWLELHRRAVEANRELVRFAEVCQAAAAKLEAIEASK